MQNTTNFNLQKPDYNNVADIQVINNNFDKIDNGIAPFFVATLNSSNVYEITTGLSITSISDGFGIRIAIPSDSTGAVSIIIDGLTAVPVKKPNGGAVSNFKANGVYSLTYYNGNFILVSGGGCDGDKVTATEKDVLINKTFIGTDEEIHTGTMPELGTVTKTLAINETFTLGEGHINSLNVNQNIPLMNPSWNDIHETDQAIVGEYMYNNGARYALLKVPNAHYINGCNWVCYPAPHLWPENIVAGKNILGVGGSAPVFSQGNFTKNKNENELKTISLGFKPKFVYIVAKNNNDNTDEAIYFSMGYQEYIPVLPKYFWQNNKSVTTDLIIDSRYQNSPLYLTILDNGFQFNIKMPNETGSTQTIYWCALG